MWFDGKRASLPGVFKIVSSRKVFGIDLPAYRNRGLGKWLVVCILSHLELQGLRRWMLATRDALGFYHRYGFPSLKEPGRFMQITRAPVEPAEPGCVRNGRRPKPQRA